MKDNKKHPLFILSFITLILTLFLAGIVTYWIFIPDTIIKMDNATAVPVDKTVYNAGDRITYTISYCKKRKLVGKVSRALVDGYRISFGMKESDLPAGCHTTKVNELRIPLFTQTGIYHIETTIIYQNNPIKTSSFYWRSVDFKVVNNNI